MLSFEVTNSNTDPLDDVQQSFSLPYDSSLPSDSLAITKDDNHGHCLSRQLFMNMFNRNRRASISRPYFQHWRGARDNRLTTKNLLAFSPRLGRRAFDFDPTADASIKKRQFEENECNDFESFLAGYLQGKNIDIIYKDSSKICLSQAVSNDFLQEFLDKFNASRLQKDTQERHIRSEHPFWLRYRLG